MEQKSLNLQQQALQTDYDLNRLVRMTGKTPYYNPYKTVVNYTFIKYYLPQFCSQTVYEDLYYKAFSYALDCLSTALVFFDSSG